MTTPPASAVAAQAATARGHLDLVTRDRIGGWAVGDDLGEPVALQILVDGRPIARILANSFRDDLYAAGIGDGRHGFDLVVPGGLSPLSRHIIQARREADGTELTDSPQVIEAAGAFDDAIAQAVARAVDAIGDDAERACVLAFLAAQTDKLLQLHADSDSERGRRRAHRLLTRRGDPLAAGLDAGAPRALVIDERVPVSGRDGGSQAMLSHIRALQSLGYQVSLAAADEWAGGDAAELMQQEIALCGAPFYASVEEVLRRQADSFDVVYLHRASVAGRYLNLVRQHQPRARVLYSVADLHHVRMERQAAIEDRTELLAASRSMRLLECTAAWSADVVLTHSSDEAALLRQAVPEAKVHRVLWSLQLRPGAASFAERSGIAFFGYYGHPPNLDAAQWLLQAVMPRVWEREPMIKCLLVGSDLPSNLRRLASAQVRIVGHVADLGAGVLDQIRLTVAPLRFGAGVKAKVLESLARGVPCVMSPVAAEGMGLPADLLAMVGRDEAELAALICQYRGDIVAHAKAVAGGMAFIGNAFSEDAVARALRVAIEDR